MSRNPLRSDPTRTGMQRRALSRDIRRRFNRLKREITDLIVTQDVFGLKQPTQNACGAGAPVSNLVADEYVLNAFDFAAVMLDAGTKRVRKEIIRLQGQIDPGDVLKHDDWPHVTVRFGLHDPDPDMVRAITDQHGPIRLRFGGVSVFQGQKQDVVKIDVESDSLRALNGHLSLLPNTQTFATYIPHMTVSFVKPGTGAKYAGMLSGLEGKEFTMGDVVYSTSKEKQTVLSLGGGGGEGCGAGRPGSPGFQPGNTCGVNNWRMVLNAAGCGAGVPGRPGFQPGNTCGRGDGGGSWTADKMPADLEGEVEIFDTNTGQSFTETTAAEARVMFAEELQQSGTLEGLSIRTLTPERKAEKKREEEEFWGDREKAAKREEEQSRLKTPQGLLPGHDDYVNPPDELWHASYNVDDIRQQGFKSSDELKRQTLGGTSSHLVSFITRENAEAYKEGLKTARQGARGELDDAALMGVGLSYGVPRSEMNLILSQTPGDDPKRRSFDVLQRVSMETKGKFPLFMGGNWPEHIAKAKEPGLVSISSKGILDIRYNPGETEWRVGDVGLTANVSECGVGAVGSPGFQRGNTCGKELATNMVANTVWQFLTRDQQLAEFTNWLRGRVSITVLARLHQYGQLDDDHWLQQHIERTYAKGMERAFDALRKPQFQEKLDFYQGTKEEFLRQSFGRPVSKERVKLLAGRALNELQGVTDDMATRMSRSLVDGFIKGDSPWTIARDLNREVDGIGKARSERIAQTEIVRAHNEGQLDALENLGMESVGVAVEWETSGLGITAKGNPSPCPLCAPLAGAVFEIKKAKGMLPRHPFCRCSWIPAGVGESPEEVRQQKRTKDRLRKAINRSISAERPKTKKRSLEEQRRRSRWVGATRKIERDVPKSII